MPDDEDHAIADQLPCGRDRLLGIAEVVHCGELNLLAEDAAGGVDICHRLRGAALHLLAEPGILAGHRPGHANQNLGRRGRSAECRQNAN
jgi:hypothetical protein